MKTVLLVSAAVVFLLAQFISAQPGHAEHPHEHGMIEEGAAQEGEMEPEDAGNKICPVGGEEITEDMKVTYAYEGKVYNFCCPMCIDEFKKDPQKYIDKIKELEGEEAEEEL